MQYNAQSMQPPPMQPQPIQSPMQPPPMQSPMQPVAQSVQPTPVPAHQAAPSQYASGGRDRWATLLQDAANKPSKKSVTRMIVVPLVTAFAVIILLVALNPPFVCNVDGRNSVFRLLVWGAIAAGATSLLSAHGMFARFC